MVHQMGLYDEYFQSIKSGRKKYEVRLNDEKRRNISIDDQIEFINVQNEQERLKVNVVELIVFPNFQEMYERIPFEQFDCDDWTMEDMLQGTYEIYTLEQEKQWGTLAIGIEVTL